MSLSRVKSGPPKSPGCWPAITTRLAGVGAHALEERARLAAGCGQADALVDAALLGVPPTMDLDAPLALLAQLVLSQAGEGGVQVHEVEEETPVRHQHAGDLLEDAE